MNVGSPFVRRDADAPAGSCSPFDLRQAQGERFHRPLVVSLSNHDEDIHDPHG
jgi:hypothetical protein